MPNRDSAPETSKNRKFKGRRQVIFFAKSRKEGNLVKNTEQRSNVPKGIGFEHGQSKRNISKGKAAITE
ncbi:hypothetical protein K1719_047011 [Acacia pycnantha]|nr:hypothetical protein K1719_047011 [Acacia pycnantha]